MGDWTDRYKSWADMVREMRRSCVTVVVERGNEGMHPIFVETPTDGTFIEVSPAYARALHEHEPLVFDKAVDRDTGHFHFAEQIGAAPDDLLKLPPYEDIEP